MRSVLAGAVLVLLTACSGGGVPASSGPGGTELVGPFRHENLEIYLVRKPGVSDGLVEHLTMEEGFQAGTLRVTEVSEAGDVNELEIENTGARPVYLQAGDTVKGGKQDRTIATDFVLPPKSGKTRVDAFCVEPGRWSLREQSAGGAAPLSGATFSLAEAPVATKEQKLAVRDTAKQEEVWEAGRKANAGLALQVQASEVQDSFVLAAEDPKVKEKLERYRATLSGIASGREGVVGAVFLVNGRPSTAELYASPGLFRKLWPRLLQGAAVEALAKAGDPPAATGAGLSEVRSLLEGPSAGEERRETLPAGVVAKRRDGKESACFDTEQGGVLLRRQVIAK